MRGISTLDSASSSENASTSASAAVDGNAATRWSSAFADPQWLQVDLGAPSKLFYLLFWHFHAEPVIFRDVIVQVSNDPNFKNGVTTLFNNDIDNSSGLGIGKDREYFETSEGRLVDAKGTTARYVRLYSAGSTYTDPLNRYTEVEVYGLPSK